jgi:hypothetical protein
MQRLFATFYNGVHYYFVAILQNIVGGYNCFGEMFFLRVQGRCV